MDYRNRNIIIDTEDQINEDFDMFGEEVDDAITSPANKKILLHSIWLVKNWMKQRAIFFIQ